jgi:hypothetical protein
VIGFVQSRHVSGELDDHILKSAARP